MAITIWPAILSAPHVKFLAWGTIPVLPTPINSHGRAAMAMALSLATFYSAWPWPWPYTWAWATFWGYQLPIPTTRYKISVWGNQSTHVEFLAWGDQSPHTPTCGHGPAAMAMAVSLATFYRASPWPWPHFTEALCTSTTLINGAFGAVVVLLPLAHEVMGLILRSDEIFSRPGENFKFFAF